MKTKPYRHKVLYRECDMMRVVNNSVYVGWMEDARVDALAQLGLNYNGMEENGFAGPVLSLSVDYKSSARFGDDVDITDQIILSGVERRAAESVPSRINALFKRCKSKNSRRHAFGSFPFTRTGCCRASRTLRFLRAASGDRPAR